MGSPPNIATPLSLLPNIGAGSHQKSLQLPTQPREKALRFLCDRGVPPSIPRAVSTKVSTPNIFFHWEKQPCFGWWWWPSVACVGGRAGSGPLPPGPNSAPFIDKVPAANAEVIASDALLPWEWLVPRIFSYVVMAREIWTNWTNSSIVTQVIWRAAHMVSTMVYAS